jgi:hypothetical protein
MATWSEDEIKAIAVSDDLHVSPFRDDGVTCGTPTWVWSVVVDGDLYVRAYNGHASRWCQAAMRQRGGRISVGRNDAGRELRACRGSSQRTYRRCLPNEIPQQHLSEFDDRQTVTRRDRQNPAARLNAGNPVE